MYYKQTLKELEQAGRRYEREVDRIFENTSNAKKKCDTVSGLLLKPLYTPMDNTSTDFYRDVDFFPAQYPYTRGFFQQVIKRASRIYGRLRELVPQRIQTRVGSFSFRMEQLPFRLLGFRGGNPLLMMRWLRDW